MTELTATKGSDRWMAITPSDSTAYTSNGGPGLATAERPRALFIGVGGDVAIADTTGAALTFKNLPSGALLPVQPSKVMSTGTTATNILGLY